MWGEWGAGKVFQAEEQHEQRLRGTKQPGVCWRGAGWEAALQVLCWSVEMSYAERQRRHCEGLYFIIYRMGTTSSQLVGVL